MLRIAFRPLFPTHRMNISFISPIIVNFLLNTQLTVCPGMLLAALSVCCYAQVLGPQTVAPYIFRCCYLYLTASVV
jgi:hypothetical protein